MELKFRFEPLCTVQAAAQVVIAAGGRIDSEKLLNILYMADRTSLIETGSPITGDQMYLTPNKAYGLFTVFYCIWDSIAIRGWNTTFKDEDRYVVLYSGPGDSELSDYDVALLQREYAFYRGPDASFLPEWKQLKMEAPITLPKPEDILRAEGFSEEHVIAYQERYAPIQAMDRIRIIR